MAWVGCVAQFYYKIHLLQFGNRKKVLTQEVAKLGDSLLNTRRHLKPLDDSSFTRYELSYKASGKYIRVDKSSVEEFVGSDTIFRLCPNKEQNTTKSKEADGGRKRKAAPSASPPPPRKRNDSAPPSLQAMPSRQRKNVSYAEYEFDSGGDDSKSDEEVEEEHACTSPSQFNGAPPAVAKSNPRNSTATAKLEPTGSSHRNAWQGQLSGDDRDYKVFCDELIKQNQELKEENNKLRAVRTKNIALTEKVDALQAEITAVREENKAIRAICAQKDLDYHRLEFLVKEKAENDRQI